MQSVGERIRGAGDEVQPVIERRLDRRGRGVPGLDFGRAVDADGVVENAVSGADHRVVVELVSEADARQEGLVLAVPQFVAIGAGEQQAAAHLELAHRESAGSDSSRSSRSPARRSDSEWCGRSRAPRDRSAPTWAIRTRSAVPG